MKFLHIVRTLDPRSGGPVESLRQRTPVLQRMGHDVEVVSLEPGPEDRGAPDFAPTHYKGVRSAGYGFAGKFVPWLRATAPRFDAVIVHGLWQYQGFGTWRALRGGRVPYFVFPHGMLDPWFKRTYPLKHLKKWLYWPWGEYRVLRDARAVLFTCEEERRLARASFPLYRCTEAVVNYGTSPPTGERETQRLRFLARFPHLTGKRNLLFLGRVHVKKGPDLVLRAFAGTLADQPAATGDLHLIMAGPCDHDYGRAMQQLAASLGLQHRVTWTGMITGDEKWGAFYASDAFILPSHQENFGIAVVEALACGVPVLISNQVNIWREIHMDGVGLVETDDLAGTRALLRRWMEISPEQLAKMRSDAKASFARRYHIDRAAESLVEAMELFGVMPFRTEAGRRRPDAGGRTPDA